MPPSLTQPSLTAEKQQMESSADRNRFTANLNPEQQEAVETIDGPLLIFAGAGSGKTRVLTHRIAHLVFAHRVPPHQILAVTFTNKAAREMKERVERLLAGRSLPVWVATFHSTCVRILRQHAHCLDFTPQFVIYDSSDSLSTMKRVFKRLNIDPQVIDPKQTLSAIDRAKNAYKSPEDLRKELLFTSESSRLIAQLYEEYQRELREANAMDFGDLLCNVVTLFQLEPAIRDAYRERFRYLMIDEYQDTNHVQYLFIRQILGNHNNICVVGDDDQSIYGFRGANVSTILNFQSDFPGAKVVTLETNYRSTSNILKAANSVIAVNTNRHPKSMRTENPEGQPIVCFQAYDERDEAEFVVREICSLLHGGVEPKQIAIFYRTNAQSRAIEEELCETGLPYQIFGGHRFYERKEIKDILAYLRLLVNPADNDAFLRIINVPARGLGAAAVGTVINYSAQEGVPLLEALRRLVQDSSKLTKAVRTKFSGFLAIFDSLVQVLHDAQESLSELAKQKAAQLSANTISALEIERVPALATILKEIGEQSGYLKALREQDTLETEARIENIEELCRVAVEFVERCIEQGVTPTISDFLDRANLSSDLDKRAAEQQANHPTNHPTNQEGDSSSSIAKPTALPQDFISLMTLHLAKGLEFDFVFLLGLEEGILPHVRAISQPEELEEERRLCYVGITRARKQLYILRATNRQNFGRSNWYSGIPSRFLRDIPREVVDERGSDFMSDLDLIDLTVLANNSANNSASKSLNSQPLDEYED